MIKRFVQTYNRRLIAPRSSNPDDQRREYIFNVLIAFFTLGAVTTTASSGINHLLGANAHAANSVPVTVGFFAVSAGLWWLSRKGHYKVGAYALVGLVWLASFQLALAWSIELPMAQVMSILVIVLAGIMLGSRAALAVTLATSASTLMLGYLEVTHGITADVSWLTKPLEFSDAIGLVVIYMVVGAISWLSNNEIDKLLRRAWRSEAALTKERDMLEVTVAKRTKDLERVQLERTLQLQQLAEYGQVSASLIHDLATPVTAASLSLEQADGVKQAAVSVNQIQDYIASVRKQLQGSGVKRRFNPNNEISNILTLLTSQARTAQVEVVYSSSSKGLILGDPAAFSRVIANLVVNAIQSYRAPKKRSAKSRVVQVSTDDVADQLIITIQDFGQGIKPADMPRIFDDYYSTKKHIGRGLGLGLSSAKKTIAQDFNGTITVTSALQQGTIFTIGIPQHEQSNTTKHTKRPQVSGRKSKGRR